MLGVACGDCGPFFRGCAECMSQGLRVPSTLKEVHQLRLSALHSCSAASWRFRAPSSALCSLEFKLPGIL
jgi:hypothetical protein